MRFLFDFLLLLCVFVIYGYVLLLLQLLSCLLPPLLPPLVAPLLLLPFLGYIRDNNNNGNNNKSPSKRAASKLNSKSIKKKNFLPSFVCSTGSSTFSTLLPPSPLPSSTCLAAAEYLTSFQFLAATWFSFTHAAVVVVVAVFAAVKQIFLLVEFSYFFF